MKKNNNKKVKKTPYEIKQNTSYFVKNRLPAFVLAGFIIFWTIASIFGIIAYARTKKEDNQGLITASADEVNPYYVMDDFTIDLPFLSGLYGFQTLVGDGAFLHFEGQRCYFVPNGYREDFLANDSNILNRSEFLITGMNGQSLGEIPFSLNIISLANGAGVSDFTVTALSNFALSQDTYDYYSFGSYELSVERVDFRTVNYIMRLPILFYLGGQLINQGSFSIQFSFDYVVAVGSTSVACPYFGFYTELPTLPLTLLGEVYSTLNNELAYFYFEYNKTYDLYQNAVNSLNATQFDYSQTLNQLTSLRGAYEVLNINYKDSVSKNISLQQEIDALIVEKENLQQAIVDLQARINSAYSEGKSVGYQNGYEVGVIAGASTANEYTFDGLLSAVIDVPIRTFRSLFNFDLLGINLANFFLSLLTVCVILAVVRWLM